MNGPNVFLWHCDWALLHWHPGFFLCVKNHTGVMDVSGIGIHSSQSTETLPGIPHQLNAWPP